MFFRNALGHVVCIHQVPYHFERVAGVGIPIYVFKPSHTAVGDRPPIQIRAFIGTDVISAFIGLFFQVQAFGFHAFGFAAMEGVNMTAASCDTEKVHIIGKRVIGCNHCRGSAVFGGFVIHIGGNVRQLYICVLVIMFGFSNHAFQLFRIIDYHRVMRDGSGYPTAMHVHAVGVLGVPKIGCQ